MRVPPEEQRQYADETNWTTVPDGSVVFAVWTTADDTVATVFAISPDELDRMVAASKAKRSDPDNCEAVLH